MGKYHITGGGRIRGEVRVGGGKNAVLPILAATVLNNGVSVIHDCPELSDTFITIDILKSIGCKVTFAERTITVDSSTLNSFCVPENLVKEMRSSIIFLGGLLGRLKKVLISYPGGCELGARPIDLHLAALGEMGASITESDGLINCEAPVVKGAQINLRIPSVGATENIMLAAVLAEGVTVIQNAAKEPEICDLQNFLNAMGACVRGAGTDTVFIAGVKKLHDAEYTVMPDRIVAGTLLTAAAMTEGEILLNNINYAHIEPITSKLEDMGCSIKKDSGALLLKAPGKLRTIPSIVTQPHPGFPTDMQPQFMAMLSLCNGKSVFYETVFESRNKHIKGLQLMGADIVLAKDGQTSYITGVDKLRGATVEANDLRSGAALILAGIAADGETVVLNSKYVERGYERLDKVLNNLGANISYAD